MNELLYKDIIISKFELQIQYLNNISILYNKLSLLLSKEKLLSKFYEKVKKKLEFISTKYCTIDVLSVVTNKFYSPYIKIYFKLVFISDNDILEIRKYISFYIRMKMFNLDVLMFLNKLDETRGTRFCIFKRSCSYSISKKVEKNVLSLNNIIKIIINK